MAVSLAGKTAIITGAGSGINYHFAHSLLSRNCNVLFADLALRPEARALIAAHSPPSPSSSSARAIFQETNVREWDQLERMFTVATREFGGADIVCPGAGIYEPVSSPFQALLFHHLHLDPHPRLPYYSEAQRVTADPQTFSSFWHPPSTTPSRDPPHSSRYASLDINLTHPIRTTQLALSHFLSPSHSSSTSRKPPVSPTNPKAIIHTSSIAGQVTPLAAPLYNATKHALNGFVRTLGPLEARIGVRVVCVAPGVIRTPLWTEDPLKRRLVQEGKGDAWVEPEWVAETMVEMVSQREMEVEGGKRMEAGGTRVKIEGGMVVEVAKGRRRVVEQFGDEGPRGKGNTVSGMGKVEGEIWEALREGWGR